MPRRAAVAWAEVPVELTRATHADLDALRRRLGVGSAQDEVTLDALEDDLREAEGALGAVTDWLGAAEQALRDPRLGRRDLAALAAGGAPARGVEALGEAVERVRRRLGQLAARFP